MKPLALRYISLILQLLVLGPALPARDVGSERPAKGVELTAEQAITGLGKKPEQINAGDAAIHRHLRERPAELRAAALKHLNAPDAQVRSSALYALALTSEPGPSLEALKPFLQSKDVNERMLAAGSLLARGQKAAIPAIITALDSKELLAYRKPPQRAWQVARYLLIQYTDEDLGLIGKNFDAAKAKAAKPTWEKWWTNKGASLRWDVEARRYRE